MILQLLQKVDLTDSSFNLVTLILSDSAQNPVIE